MSSTGRKRMIIATVKSVAVLVFACTCLWGGYEVYLTWQTNPSKLKAPVKSAIVREVVLRGQRTLTLDQPWVVRTLALPKTADLMELDLFALRERLLASGQVQVAELTRKFPDTLVVTLEERSPVARIRARVGGGEPENLLVSRDGAVFRGECYKQEVIESLPFLAGIALKRSSGKFLPVQGMDTVADLLSIARVNAPNLYHNWSVVSLDRLGPDGQIVVQSSDVGEVVFGTRDDFYKQIARLDYIISEARNHPVTTPLKSINLAVGGEQVPVSFQLPAAPAPGSEREHNNSGSHGMKTPTSATVPTGTLAASAPHSTFRAPPTRPQQATTTGSHHITRRDF